MTSQKNDQYEETIIIKLGQTEEFADGLYKIAFDSYTQNFGIKCSLHAAVVPTFIVSATTKEKQGYNLTTVCIKVETANAEKVKTTWKTEGISLKTKLQSKSYESVSKNTNLTNTTIKWSGDGKVHLTISYVVDGKTKEQSYEILSLATTEKTSYSSTKVSSEKKIFLNSSISALKYANLTDSQTASLKTISGASKQTKIKVPAARVLAERKKLIKSIDRALIYIDFSEKDKESLLSIKK
ncbi:hypothetical protein [Methanosarcina horonobensis]|uniref:hypothetical protein n=1 Tax=Methanosarcina horonobensis TaxID=418008 RepID=UPI000A6244D7|nr:hypothetical protein [Methanosarcina horonobensis]